MIVKSQGLLTDRRVTSMSLGRNLAKTFDIRFIFEGHIYSRTGFETSGQAWRWACEQVYAAG